MRGGIYINNLYYNINTKDEKVKDYILEFIDVLEEYDYLKFVEIPYLWKVYAESIGKEIYYNCEVMVEILELKENIEMISDDLYKDILKDYKREDVENKSLEFKEKLKEYENALNSVMNLSNIDLKGLKNKKRIREVYKKLIFYYHPIIRKDKAELWKEISKAYIELNLEILEKIYFLGKDFGYAEYKWETVMIEGYKDQFKNATKELKNSFPFVLKDEILDDKWRTKQENELHERSMSFENQRTLLKGELNNLENELKKERTDLKKFF